VCTLLRLDCFTKAVTLKLHVTGRLASLGHATVLYVRTATGGYVRGYFPETKKKRCNAAMETNKCNTVSYKTNNKDHIRLTIATDYCKAINVAIATKLDEILVL